MRARDWLTFRFPRPVSFPVHDAEQFSLDLQSLTAAPMTFGKAVRRQPLRGRVSGVKGYVRWKLSEYRFQSPRTLWFGLEDAQGETTLRGEFVMWATFRVIVCAWLWVGLLFNLEQILVPSLFYHRPWREASLAYWSFLIGPAMAYGYAWLVIAVGRDREKDLERVLRTVAQGPVQAQAVRDLLVR